MILPVLSSICLVLLKGATTLQPGFCNRVESRSLGLDMPRIQVVGKRTGPLMTNVRERADSWNCDLLTS